LWWIVAHLNELTESDFELLEKLSPKFHVVYCPRSHGYFGHNRFSFERLRALGFNISLGTDRLASNDSLSLFAETRAFQKEFPAICPEEILELVTVNPAMALGQKNLLGRIRPGFIADLIAVPCRGEDSALDEIIAFDGPVDWMLLNGDRQRNTADAAN
jgi:cytosine/adenosine deaminase-related metal-dependent hydrolase